MKINNKKTQQCSIIISFKLIGIPNNNQYYTILYLLLHSVAVVYDIHKTETHMKKYT